MGNKPDIPSVLNQRKAKKLLEQHRWTAKHGSKHLKMTKLGRRPITLPDNHGQDYPPGLRSAILRQAGLAGPSAEQEPDDE